MIGVISGIKYLTTRIAQSITERKERKQLAHLPKIPLTKRNVETFEEEQLVNDACDPNIQRIGQVQISEWLRLLPRVRPSPAPMMTAILISASV